MKLERNRREKLRITVLVENTGGNNCPGEHGLSLLIEDEEYKILLDAGKSPLFSENAKRLGIDMEKVDCAVLSHAHYDHSDGLDIFFERNQQAKFYLSNGTGNHHNSGTGCQ